jgi:hypothetical protein
MGDGGDVLRGRWDLEAGRATFPAQCRLSISIHAPAPADLALKLYPKQKSGLHQVHALFGFQQLRRIRGPCFRSQQFPRKRVYSRFIHGHRPDRFLPVAPTVLPPRHAAPGPVYELRLSVQPFPQRATHSRCQIFLINAILLIRRQGCDHVRFS